MSGYNGNLCGSGEGDFFLHQFFNDLGGSFMISRRFSHDVINGRLGQPKKTHFPLIQPARTGGAEFGNGAGQFFVQRVVFFIGQVYIFHHSLLSLHLSVDAVSAVHCVKDPDRIITNEVIENFNRVTRPVETNKAVFVAVAFHLPVENPVLVGMDDVFPCYAVLERRTHKHNFRLHVSTIPHNGEENKE